MSDGLPRAPIAGLDRRSLSKATKQVLNHGNWGNPDVLLVTTGSGSVVVKDFAPRRRWIRRWFGPWVLRREARAYHQLAGVAGVPRLLGVVDREAIVLEYRPGRFVVKIARG